MNKFRSFVREELALTLQYHDTLNKLIWDGEEMIPKIQERLLYIGHLWAEFANIPDNSIRDIVLTGGNANFNYTPYSDLDVHVCMDMSKIPHDKEFLADYLIDKKMLWAYKHPALTVMGYPVELYAQNYRDPVASHQGVYSLMKKKWISKPNIEKHPDFANDTALKAKIQEYITMIETVLSEPGDHVAEIKKLKEKFREMRSAGIHQSGEFSNENLIFKELRNRGYFQKLNDYLQKTQDAQLSLY